MEEHKEITGLKAAEDAYGNNIADTYFGRGGGYDIIEREDGHFTLNGDSDAYTEEFGDWSEIQKEASRYVTGKVLDIGCGGGKHSVHFQNQGIWITGMDNSPLALQVCRERGLKNTLLCDVLHLNENVIRDLDAIIMWGNNFGLLQNPNVARSFFQRCKHICKKESRILVESLDPDGKAFLMEDDLAYIRENRLNGRMGGQVRVRVRYRHFVTPWKDYLFVSKNELIEILSGTGWKITEVLEDQNINQYIAVIEQIQAE
jgi:SAM-dependent methyltransferase